jgi:hypothetical protein
LWRRADHTLTDHGDAGSRTLARQEIGKRTHALVAALAPFAALVVALWSRQLELQQRCPAAAPGE